MTAADLAAGREALAEAYSWLARTKAGQEPFNGLIPDEVADCIEAGMAALARVEADTLTLEQSRDTALRKMGDWQAIAADRLERIRSLEADTLRDLRALHEWASEQNAGNAFAEQVAYWARAKLERIAGDTGEAT